MQITKEQFNLFFPTCPRLLKDTYFENLNIALDESEINNNLRLAAFVAQIGHESGDLKWFEELASGQEYEGRHDLGNTQAGDGKRFKGRGPLQLTGRYAYDKYSKELDIDMIKDPTLAAKPEWGFKIAILFWNDKGLNHLADEGNFREITHRINGGYTHYDDRLTRYEIAKKELGC